MAKIIWSIKALDDLKAIYDYISSDSELYAFRFVDYLYHLVDVLEEFPKSGRIVPEKENPSIRELIYGNYRIFYRIKAAGGITILRVYHASRNIN